MGVYKRGNRWWIEYRYEGKRHREGAGRTKRVALQALAIRRSQIAQGEFRIGSAGHAPRLGGFAPD